MAPEDSEVCQLHAIDEESVSKGYGVASGTLANKGRVPYGLAVSIPSFHPDVLGLTPVVCRSTMALIGVLFCDGIVSLHLYFLAQIHKTHLALLNFPVLDISKVNI